MDGDADFGLPLVFSCFFDFGEDEFDASWNDAFCVEGVQALHGIGFATACLSVGEDADILAIDGALDELCEFIEDVLLVLFHVEDLLEIEDVVFLVVL